MYVPDHKPKATLHHTLVTENIVPQNSSHVVPF